MLPTAFLFLVCPPLARLGGGCASSHLSADFQRRRVSYLTPSSSASLCRFTFSAVPPSAQIRLAGGISFVAPPWHPVPPTKNALPGKPDRASILYRHRHIGMKKAPRHRCRRASSKIHCTNYTTKSVSWSIIFWFTPLVSRKMSRPELQAQRSGNSKHMGIFSMSILSTTCFL